MTDILSLLASSYHIAPLDTSRDDLEVSPHKYSPMRERRSPFKRKLSKENKDDMVLRDSQIDKLKVHKSIAESLFSGFNIYQYKRKVTPLKQNNNANNKQIKYTPRRQMKDQMKKYIHD